MKRHPKTILYPKWQISSKMACMQITDHGSKIKGSRFQFAHTFNLRTKTTFGWEGPNPCSHCLYIISDRQLLPICAEKVQCHADADLRSKAPLRGLTLPLYTHVQFAYKDHFWFAGSLGVTPAPSAYSSFW